MTAFLALLRGINVGGNKQIRMDALKALHESLGFSDVATHIQSGNVIFTGDEADVTRHAAQIEAEVEATFGFHVAIVVRTAAMLRDVIDRNPFPEQATQDPQRLMVVFLRDTPDEQAQADLLTAYAGPETIRINGTEAYIYYPDGMGRSKLTITLIEKKLRTVGTARNWNTTLKLMAMLEALAARDH